ncbi:MAG: hypothetical protein ACE5G2_01200, partial [Candidatus Krumholzibacteriia bacterium]
MPSLGGIGYMWSTLELLVSGGAVVRVKACVFAGILAISSSLASAGPKTSRSPSLVETYHEAAERLIGAALTSDHASLRLSQLCDGIGHRLSGSRSLERAIEWAADAMREDGLDVRLQPVTVPVWVRGREEARMVEPRSQPLSMLGLGRSVGTP